jgi:hypothetical protein
MSALRDEIRREAALAARSGQMNRLEWLADRVDEQLAEAWDEGYYSATNGKWGPPEDGANPYRKAE